MLCYSVDIFNMRFSRLYINVCKVKILIIIRIVRHCIGTGGGAGVISELFSLHDFVSLQQSLTRIGRLNIGFV